MNAVYPRELRLPKTRFSRDHGHLSRRVPSRGIRVFETDRSDEWRSRALRRLDEMASRPQAGLEKMPATRERKSLKINSLVVGRRGIEPRTHGLKARSKNEENQGVTGILRHQASQRSRRERRYWLTFSAGGVWVFREPTARTPGPA